MKLPEKLMKSLGLCAALTVNDAQEESMEFPYLWVGTYHVLVNVHFFVSPLNTGSSGSFRDQE